MTIDFAKLKAINDAKKKKLEQERKAANERVKAEYGIKKPS